MDILGKASHLTQSSSSCQFRQQLVEMLIDKLILAQFLFQFGIGFMGLEDMVQEMSRNALTTFVQEIKIYIYKS